MLWGQGSPEAFYQIGEAKPPPSLLLVPVRGGGQKGARVENPGRASTASEPVGLFRFLFGHKKERLRGCNGSVEVLPPETARNQRSPTGLLESNRFPRGHPPSKQGHPPVSGGKPPLRRPKISLPRALKKPKKPFVSGRFEFSTFSTVFSTINMSFPHSKLKRKVFKNFPEFLHSPFRKTQHPFFRVTIGNPQVFHGFHTPYYYYCISISVNGRLTP